MQYRGRFREKLFITMLILLLFILVTTPPTAQAAGFTPAPTTPYATQFIEQCESQQWFMDEIEKLLNQRQHTINNLANSSDLDFIVSLGLKDQNISGHLPRAISQLTKLRTLFLSGNQISGAIPSELYSLQELYNIDLSDNLYEGNIPAQFGSMPALQILNLRGNNYSGTIPTAILSNTKLTFLDVSSNNLSGGLPAALSQMTALEYLSVADNPWGGLIPDLSALSNLITFSAWNCNLSGTIPASIYTLDKLQVLDLAQNDLTGEIGSAIGNLTDMQLLSIADNRVGGLLPDEIGNLTELMTLDVENNWLRGHVPAAVLDIDEVYIANNYMTGPILAQLERNADNFGDEATTQQYNLTTTDRRAIITVRQTLYTNVYNYLRNELVTNTSITKPLLPANCYEAEIINDPSNKIEVAYDSQGVYVKANVDTIESSENIRVIVRIKDNTNSEYSQVSILVTTATTGGNFGGGGGGGGGGQTITLEELGDEDIPLSNLHEPYVNGYPDGTFLPGNNVTREEIAAMLIRALQETTRESLTTTSYTDVAPERWSAIYIERATELGILEGYGNGIFGPGRNMTRAELAAALVRIMQSRNSQGSSTGATFSDLDSSRWYYDTVLTAVSLGLITGYEDGTFRPDQTVSRAEAVTMINRMLPRDPATAPVLRTLTNPFSDLNTNYWAYLQIMEAAVMHEHAAAAGDATDSSTTAEADTADDDTKDAAGENSDSGDGEAA